MACYTSIYPNWEEVLRDSGLVSFPEKTSKSKVSGMRSLSTAAGLKAAIVSFLCTRSKLPSHLANTAASLPYVGRADPWSFMKYLGSLSVLFMYHQIGQGNTKRCANGPPGCQAHSSLSLLSTSGPTSC